MRTASAGWCHHSLDWHFLVERSHLTCLNEKWLGPFTSPPKGKVSHIKPWWGYVGMRTKHCVHYISLLDITKSLYLIRAVKVIHNNQHLDNKSGDKTVIQLWDPQHLRTNCCRILWGWHTSVKERQIILLVSCHLRGELVQVLPSVYWISLSWVKK
jgi:hypothetical protein